MPLAGHQAILLYVFKMHLKRFKIIMSVRSACIYLTSLHFLLIVSSLSSFGGQGVKGFTQNFLENTQIIKFKNQITLKSF